MAHIAQIVEEKNDPHYSSQVEDLLNLEVIHRQGAKLARLVKYAGFSALKTFEEYNFDAISFQGKYDQETISKLERIGLKENIILMGNVGIGKKHMSIALGIDACQKGKSVKFYKEYDLVETLALKYFRR